jgi:hypothetical protein
MKGGTKLEHDALKSKAELVGICLLFVRPPSLLRKLLDRREVAA